MSRIKHESPTHAANDVQSLRDRIAELERENAAYREAEQALRASEQLNRNIIQYMQGGLVQISMDGKFMTANAEALRILRLSEHELKTSLVPDFAPVTIHEDGTPYAVEDYPVSICLRTGKPVAPALIGLRHRDGGVTWAVFAAAPILDPVTNSPESAVVTFIDVTEQRRTQQSLRLSEQKYRTLINTTVTGYLVVDTAGRVLDANEEYVRLAGYQALPDILGRSVIEWTAPHDIERNAREVQLATERGYVRNLEVDYISPEGRITPIEINATLLKSEHGPIMLSLCRDISERREVERKIKASRAWFESLVHSVDGIVWEANSETFRFTFVSQKAEHLLGYPVNQWLDEPDFWVKHMHPEDRESSASYCLKATREGRDHQFEYRMITADGRPIWLRDIVTVVPESHLLRGLMVDITATKQAQETLRFQAALLASVRESVIGTDLEGRIIYWGRGAEMLYGFDADEVMGKVMSFAVDEHDQKQPYHRRRLALESGAWSGQSEQRRKDGSTFYGETVISLVSDHRGAPVGYIAIDRDITEQRKYQNALRDSADAQRMMLSELDHRVRNNLASLTALIDISRQHETTVKDFAMSIRGRVLAMSAVHSLLSRARWFAINLRNLIFALVPADLQEMITVEGTNVLIAPRQATAMGMILQELFANSMKYGAMRDSNGRVELTWTVAPAQDPQERTLQLVWRERGGPPITSTPQPGLGTELILGFVRTELRGTVKLAYPREGVQHEFTLLLDAVS